MLLGRNYQPSNLILPLPDRAISPKLPETLKSEEWRKKLFSRDETWMLSRYESRGDQTLGEATAKLEELLYLFACQVDWDKRGDPSSAWELISGARDPRNDVRAHARSLLETAQEVSPPPETHPAEVRPARTRAPQVTPLPLLRVRPPLAEKVILLRDILKVVSKEASPKTPYNLEIIESCVGCKVSKSGCFCDFSPSVLRSLNAVGHHTIMPAAAVLFVEGQTPRGIYVICSGIVKLSTSSKEGKVLILKQAMAGEVLGLSAAISGTNYEVTAETACPCQLNFVGRQDLITLLQNHSEAGVHAALSLSREFQGAYRDIHDLLLARSSSGKLARLLLSCAPQAFEETDEKPLRPVMTHEEMAQRIGSSRETVTRLLSDLKKKR